MHTPPAQHAARSGPPIAANTNACRCLSQAASERPGGEDGGGSGEGGSEGGGGDGGGGEGASRMNSTCTLVTDGAAGASSMVTPNALLIASRGLVCKATAADSIGVTQRQWPAVVSVATTARSTLPALTVTVSKHFGKAHCSSWRKFASIESATAANSSTVPPTLSTKVTSLAGTTSVTAPGCNGGGEGGGGEGGGLGGGGGPAGDGGGVGGGEAGGLGGGGGGGAGKEGGGLPMSEYTQLKYAETWM